RDLGKRPAVETGPLAPGIVVFGSIDDLSKVNIDSARFNEAGRRFLSVFQHLHAAPDKSLNRSPIIAGAGFFTPRPKTRTFSAPGPRAHQAVKAPRDGHEPATRDVTARRVHCDPE